MRLRGYWALLGCVIELWELQGAHVSCFDLDLKEYLALMALKAIRAQMALKGYPAQTVRRATQVQRGLKAIPESKARALQRYTLRRRAPPRLPSMVPHFHPQVGPHHRLEVRCLYGKHEESAQQGAVFGVGRHRRSVLNIGECPAKLQ